MSSSSSSSSSSVEAAPLSTKNDSTTASNFAVRVLAGSVGAVITAVAVTPLEVVKVRQQTPPPPAFSSSTGRCPDCGSTATATMRLRLPTAATLGEDTGAFATARRVVRAEGWRGLYAGLSPTLAMSVPNTVLYFCCYDETSSRLRSAFSLSKDSWLDRFGVPLSCGALSRCVATLATSPLELLRTRRAAAAGPSGSLARDLIELSRAGALRRGLAPTLWRDAPFSAAYWTALETLRAAAEPGVARDAVPPSTSFFCGAAAGAVATSVTAPFDVVKTRRQVRCCDGGAATTVAAEIAAIARDEGPRALWRGNVARTTKVAPACAVMIFCYEFGKQALS